VPHGVGCEYPKYPAGGTVAVRSTQQRFGTAGYLWAGAAAQELCAACGVQANGDGGLVGIFDGGTGHVSVVGSTLIGIKVRAHC
jgi:hypothetical protein